MGVYTSNDSFHGKHHGYLVDLGYRIFRQTQLSSDQKPSLLVILAGCRDGAWGWGHSLDVEYQTNQNCPQRVSSMGTWGISLVGGLEPWNYILFSIYWEFHSIPTDEVHHFSEG